MKKSFLFKLLSVCLLGVATLNDLGIAEDYDLNSDELILSERFISDDVAEVFIERDGKVYIRSYSMLDDSPTLTFEKELEVRKRGLNTEHLVPKSKGVGDIVENYIQVRGLNREVPTSIDYSKSKYLPPAGNQVDNSCVGWAVGYYLRTYQLGVEKDWEVYGDGKLLETRVFSPNFVYNQINDGRDNGATLDDAGELLKNVGIATMSDFEYIPGDYRSKPSYETIRKGYKYRIEDYHILFSRAEKGEYKVKKIKEYLMTGDLPVIGVDAGYSWEHPHRDQDGNSIILKDDTYIGGHAVLVVGYDDKFKTPDGVGAFKVLNSWGKEWGNDGYAYLSYESMSEDAISAAVYTDLSRFYVQDTHEPYVKGYEDNRFRPNRFITRAESVKMIMELGVEDEVSLAEFKDIDESHWANRQINLAYRNEYILGYPDGSFRPDESITRAEFTSLMYKYMGKSIPEGAEHLVTKYFYDSVGHWSSRRVSILGSMELVGGYPDGSFRPDEYITRAEAVTIINKVEERVPHSDAIDSLDTSMFEDLERDGKKHWAYYDIVEASKTHIFEYNLEKGELIEVWNY